MPVTRLVPALRRTLRAHPAAFALVGLVSLVGIEALVGAARLAAGCAAGWLPLEPSAAPLGTLSPAADALPFAFAALGAWFPRRARDEDTPTRPRRPDGDGATATDGGASRVGLGPYRLESRIGHGAAGTLWRATDERSGRAVAVKTIELSDADGDDLEQAELEARFEREATAARRLEHPDIVRVLDAGRAPGRAWLAMELLPGHDLGAHTQAGRLLPVLEVLEIGRRVALALAHAHRQGVVHRDIKPENVMVDAGSGMVKVTDFGIARLSDTTQTRTGLVLGTPAYMSPEQLAGDRVDGRSDLYSLGVLLYHLLTGAPPFEDGSAARLLGRIANEPAPDLLERRPDLPRALGDILAIALQKRPEMRYGDGRDLAADLDLVADWLRGDVNFAPPPAAGDGQPLV